jgi:hypothetical protein
MKKDEVQRDTVLNMSKSGYTPTEDELRQVYRGQIVGTGKPNVFEIIDEQQADEEFDRWLNQVRAEAWAQGFNTCQDSVYPVVPRPSRNPYRKDNQ